MADICVCGRPGTNTTSDWSRECNHYGNHDDDDALVCISRARARAELLEALVAQPELLSHPYELEAEAARIRLELAKWELEGAPHA